MYTGLVEIQTRVKDLLQYPHFKRSSPQKHLIQSLAHSYQLIK